MAIYERRCKDCCVTFTHLCKIADREEPKDCPGCGHPDTVPIMSATKTTFKFADKSGIKERR